MLIGAHNKDSTWLWWVGALYSFYVLNQCTLHKKQYKTTLMQWNVSVQYIQYVDWHYVTLFVCLFFQLDSDNICDFINSKFLMQIHISHPPPSDVLTIDWSITAFLQIRHLLSSLAREKEIPGRTMQNGYTVVFFVSILNTNKYYTLSGYAMFFQYLDKLLLLLSMPCLLCSFIFFYLYSIKCCFLLLILLAFTLPSSVNLLSLRAEMFCFLMLSKLKTARWDLHFYHGLHLLYELCELY